MNGQARPVTHVTWSCKLALNKGVRQGPSAVDLPGLEQEPGNSVGSNTLEPITAPCGEGGVRNPPPRDSGVRVPVLLTL